jgi:tetratricopeptide (TPR) repeat protein
MWERTDLYLHGGVEMRQLTDAEIQNGATTSSARDDGNEKLMNEERVTTVVPSAEKDFRGMFGDVERASKAYKDMHNHTHQDPEKALPLFRLMTWVDPSFVEGWTTGSMILARDRGEIGTAKALAFLNEGVAQNPESIDLRTQTGYLYITRRHDLVTAVKHLKEAIRLGKGRKAELPAEERDAYEEAYRWLALCYRNLGQLPEMHRTMTAGLKEFPDDPMLKQLKVPPSMILVPGAEDNPASPLPVADSKRENAD